LQQLKLIKIENPFERSRRVIARIDYRNESLLEIRRANLPDSIDVIISVNGKVIAAEQLHLIKPQAGDEILFMAKVGGDDALKIVLGLAVVVASIVTYGYAAAAWGPTYGALAASAVSVAGGLIVNALYPLTADVGGLSRKDDIEKSQWFSWNPQTLQTAGPPWPKYYGINKVHGNVIDSYILAYNKHQEINVLLHLGLGPIYPLTDFRINDQPLSNFKDARLVECRYGELYQTPIRTFQNTILDDVINTEVAYGTPVTRTTDQNDYDGFYVQMSAPSGLYYANDEGGLDPSGAVMQIEAKESSGATWINLTRYTTANGSNLNPGTTGIWTFGVWIPIYQNTRTQAWYRPMHTDEGNTDSRAHTVGAPDYDVDPCCAWQWVPAGTTNWNAVTSYTAGIWFGSSAETTTQPLYQRSLFFCCNVDHQYFDVRVTKTAADPASARYQKTIHFYSIQGYYFDKFKYPRQVLVGISAIANETLQGGFNFSCKTGGTIVRVYNGSTWTSTFSNNPAWVAWDLLTQPVLDNNDGYAVVRYDGLDPAYLDEDSFKTWADFCDVLVTNAAGTPASEKRHLFDGGFDTEGNVWENLLKICSGARAAPVWNGSKLKIVIDQDSDPVQLFNQGNIYEDMFEISYIPREERAGEIEIDFKNADKNYEKDTLTVINSSAGSATQKARIELVGPTRPSEVWRAGMLRLYQNQYCTKSVRFDVDIDALACEIGDVIQLQHDILDLDDAKSGRIVSASDASHVVIDTPVTIQGGGQTYQLIIRHNTDVIETRTVSTGAGSGITALTVSSPFSFVPSQYDVYAFGQTNEVVQEYRVIRLAQAQDQRITVNALEHNSSVYAMDTGTPLIPVDPYDPADAVYPVTNLAAVDVTTYDPNSMAANRHLVITWDIPDSGTYLHAKVYIREAAADGEEWQYMGFSVTNFMQIRNLSWSIDYEVLVATVNLHGEQLAWDSCPIVAVTAVSISPDPTLNPNVQNLRVRGEAAGNANWTGPDLHVEWDHMITVIYGIFEERKDYKVVITNSADTVRRTTYVTENSFTYTQAMNIADGLEGTLKIKVWARDTGDRESAAAAVITCTNAVPANVSGLAVTAFMGAVRFTWSLNTENDLSHYVYRLGIEAAPSGDWISTKQATVYRSITPTEKDTYGGDVNIRIAVKAVDTLGLTSATEQTANADAGSLNIQPTDIDDFAITASKLFTKIPILYADAWTNNYGVNGVVRWNAHKLYYNGVEYSISTNDTDARYIFWLYGSSSYSNSDAHPAEGDIGSDNVLNGGFASDTTNWTAGASASLSSVVGGQSGNCLQILEAGGANPYAHQTISGLTAATRYQLRLYVKQGTESTYVYKIYDVTNSAYIYSSDQAESTASWVQITKEFEIPAGCTSIRVELYQICASSAGTTIFYDTVELYRIWMSGKDFIIAVNEDGSVQLAWNAVANQVIGSAFIMDAAIGTAKIEDLAVGNAKINDIDGGKILLTSSLAINNSTFGNSGFQVQYNSGSPRLYIGDGSNTYMKYAAGTGLEISTALAAGIKVRSGGDMTIYDGGTLNCAINAASGATYIQKFIKQDDLSLIGGIRINTGTPAIRLTGASGTTMYIDSVNAGVFFSVDAGAYDFDINARYVTCYGDLKVGGSGDPSYCLHVVEDKASVPAAFFFNDGNNVNRYGIVVSNGTDDNSGTNIHVIWRDGNNDDVGYVSSSGGTVSYGAFTANHDCILPDELNKSGLPYGILLRIKNLLKHEKQSHGKGILYLAEPTSKPYDSALLGAYSDRYPDRENFHQVYILGDGHILCCNEGGDIQIGDPITSSSKPGHGMRASEKCLSIGIAQENHNFKDSYEVKLLAVQYGLRFFQP